MKNNVNDSNYTVVRYEKGYAVMLLAAACIFILFIILKRWEYYTVIFTLPMLLYGFLALSGRKYLRHDRQNKILIFDNGLSFRKYKYERIYFKGEGIFRGLYVDVNGKKKYVNFSKNICNRRDYETFCKEVEEV